MKKYLRVIAFLGATSVSNVLSGNLLAAENKHLQPLISTAQKEGTVYSLGMPDSWANWKETHGFY